MKFLFITLFIGLIGDTLEYPELGFRSEIRKKKLPSDELVQTFNLPERNGLSYQVKIVDLVVLMS